MAARRTSMAEEEEDAGAFMEMEAGRRRSRAAAALALSSEDKTERRRKQCRISQRRYRDKKGSAEYNLRLDINSLRESVERLRQAHSVLQTKLQNDRRMLTQSVLKAVEQYYVMFEHGLHDPSAGEHVRKCYEIQVNFLRAFMDPQVKMGSGVGVDAVLDQWRRYTRYHSALLIQLVTAQVFGSDSDSPIVKATGRLVVTLNRTTLEKLFPHVLANEALTQRLVDREVEYTTCTEYMFNEKVQVVRQHLTVDFLAGISALLRDPFLTSEVFRGARITEEGVLECDAASSEEEATQQADDEEEKADKPPPPDDGGSSRLDLQFIMS